MDDMTLTLTFHIRQPVAEYDLEHITSLVRAAIDEKIGEYEYLVEDIRGYDLHVQASDE